MNGAMCPSLSGPDLPGPGPQFVPPHQNQRQGEVGPSVPSRSPPSGNLETDSSVVVAIRTVRAGRVAQDRTDQRHIGQRRAGQIRVGQVRVGQNDVDKQPVGQVRVGQVPVKQIHVGKLHVGQVRASQVCALRGYVGGVPTGEPVLRAALGQ